MDIVTQGLLGATLAQSAAPRSQVRLAALVGLVAGMLPDADVLLRSDADPLLFLEYHRHFTHALVFVPVGALIAALLLWPFLRRRLPFARLYLYALLGYSLAGLLDACTSYGTHLLWPFAEARTAWGIISIVDPVFTLALLLGVGIGTLRATPVAARVALVVAGLYLMLGVVQQGRAHALGAELAAARGHSPERMSARPSFGNLLVWRLVYVRDGQVHADALRLGPLGTQVYPGASARLLDIQADFPWAPVGSVARRDLERFAFFSTGLLIEHPQRPGFIGDARYAMSPDSLRPLWGIEFAANEAGVQASWVTDRSMSEAERARFFALLRGDQALLDQ